MWRAWSPESARVDCDAEILCDLAGPDWEPLTDRWSRRPGEMSFVWTKVLDEVDQAARVDRGNAALPKELVVRAKRPDERGHTPRGGAY